VFVSPQVGLVQGLPAYELSSVEALYSVLLDRARSGGASNETLQRIRAQRDELSR
jgi:hypothetical protein